MSRQPRRTAARIASTLGDRKNLKGGSKTRVWLATEKNNLNNSTNETSHVLAEEEETGEKQTNEGEKNQRRRHTSCVNRWEFCVQRAIDSDVWVLLERINDITQNTHEFFFYSNTNTTFRKYFFPFKFPFKKTHHVKMNSRKG